MVTLKMDGKEIKAESGENLMEVLRRSGKDIPSMCYLENEAHFTSCMVCMVAPPSRANLRFSKSAA